MTRAVVVLCKNCKMFCPEWGGEGEGFCYEVMHQPVEEDFFCAAGEAVLTPNEVRNAYMREWRKKNPDKAKAINQRYWERKAKSYEA